MAASFLLFPDPQKTVLPSRILPCCLGIWASVVVHREPISEGEDVSNLVKVLVTN